MMRLFWMVWDYLTYTKYRVKIETYSNNKTVYIPQFKFRGWPVWFSYISFDEGSLNYPTEYDAWWWILGRKEYKTKNTKRTKTVSYKYEEQ